MFGGSTNTFDTVVRLVEALRPEKAYGHERKFQSDLQEYLDAELNSGGDLMGGGQSHAVSTERGASRGDVVINDEVGIELKRDFTNSQKKKLRGQLEDYADHYPFVIACACGISDMDGWRELEQKFSGRGGGLGMGQQTQFEFIHKRQDNFGSEQRSRGGFGGGIF